MIAKVTVLEVLKETSEVIGHLMDLQMFSSVFLALALLQGVLIVNAFSVRRVRRTVALPAPA